MKFDLVEPGDEQAMLPDAEQELVEDQREQDPDKGPAGVPPRLRRASERMRRRIKTDLVILESSMNQLRQAIASAPADDEQHVANTAPPRNFRADAFSGPGVSQSVN